MSPDDHPPNDVNHSSHPDEQSPQEEIEDRPLVVRSEDLMQSRREIWIEHGTEMYRLRITNSGKLLLTK